ncbi:MAG: hypothetical protein ACYTFI_10615, partial [Planctomycetota bacterium]
MKLPDDLAAMTYALTVANQVGECSGDLPILQGIQGPTGGEGPTGPIGPSGPVGATGPEGPSW